MNSKITIIGAGSVGSTIAYTLSGEDMASQIVMIDINKEKVEGEVMDIEQGTCFRDPISIVAGDYEDAKDSDIVIITSGIARKPGQTRIELAQTNVDILKQITPEIVKAAGTILDSARLRCGLSEHFQVAQRNIHAYVYGEHGDTSFVPWSAARIAGVNVDDYYEMMPKMGKEAKKLDKEAMLTYVQKSGGEIIANKGATFYAVTRGVCRLCGILMSASESVSTVSSMMHGEYGIEDVCLSTLALVGPNGIQSKIPMALTEEEVGKLKASADALKKVIAQIDI